MRIIIVEDDERTASFIIKGLKQAGFVADHASDGESGLSKYCLGSINTAYYRENRSRCFLALKV